MRCARDTVRTFSGNDKQLQGIPGATAVLHTHTRRLDYHPHVHLVMPAAAIDGKRKDAKPIDGSRKLWRTKRRGNTGTVENRTVHGTQFLWLVLQYVLPKGFRRARNFGFLHPNCKRLIALLHLVRKFDPARSLAWIKPRAPFLCSCCGAVMTIVRTRIRSLLAVPVPISIPLSSKGAG